MSKTILILGASILQLPAIRKAKEMGLKTVVADMNPEAIGFMETGVFKEIVSTIDVEGILEVAKRHCIDGIMTLASDMPMRSVAAVCEELGLCGISADTAIRATNKFAMRNALRENGVPVPRYHCVSSLSDFKRAISDFKSDYIVKPVDNSGSRGVCKLSVTDDETKMMESYHYSRMFSRNGDVIVEEYMDGPEVSVETISIDGKCSVIQITDKLTTGAPYFVEMGHSQPSRHPDEIKKKIIKVAQDANRAIGIVDGPSHTEIKITSDGPKVVEIGARLGGDCIATHLVPLSTGVDMVESCIRIALGEKPGIQPKFYRGAAIRYLRQRSGVVQNICGVKEAGEVPGVMQVSVVHGIGEQLNEIRNSSDRCGFVIAGGDNADDAIAVCEKATDLIHIEYII